MIVLAFDYGAKPATQRRVQAMILVGVDADEAKRIDELGQVCGAWCHYEQRPGGPEDPVELGAVAGSENVQHHVGAGVGEGQPAPRVADGCHGTAVRAGGAPRGGLGHVDGESVVRGQPAEYGHEVVARSRADVDYQTGRLRPTGCGVGCGFRDCPRQEGEVARVEELGPRSDHLGRLGRAGRTSRQQVDVALPGQVEAVPARAAQRDNRVRERAAA